MPAAYAHYRFGQEALSMLSPAVRKIAGAHPQLYNAGLHGKELNRLRRVIDEMDDEISKLSGEERDEKMEEMSDRKEFKEFLGHKPIEVMAGALLGIIIAMVFPLPA